MLGIEESKTYIDRAKELRPLIEANASAGEEQYRLTDEVMDALREAGFLSMWITQDLGGAELGPVAALQVIEELAYADSSTGWVMMALAIDTGAASAFLPDEGVAKFFADPEKPSVLAGQGQPNGRADKTGDSYRLTGHWGYGSGILWCDYVRVVAMVYEDGEQTLDKYGQPELRAFVVPRDEATIDGNWEVMGLRATGSVDHSVEGVEVPEAHTYLAFDMEPKRGGPVHTLGLAGTAALAHAIFPLAVARRALDELRDLVGSRKGRFQAAAENQYLLESLTDAEARVRAGRALVYETWEGIERTLAAGGRVSRRQETLARVAIKHTTFTAADVTQMAFQFAGGKAIRPSVLQRCFRDAHVASTHAVAQAFAVPAAQELLGLAEDEARWHGFGLAMPLREEMAGVAS